MKTSITYFHCEDRNLGQETRTESTGLIMSDKCMRSALHSLLIDSGFKKEGKTYKSVWNSAKAVTYVDGKLIKEVRLPKIN